MKRVPRFNPENYCHFVTMKAYNKRPLFSDEQIARLFLDVLYKKQSRLSFLLIGFVVMPDHVHLLIVPSKRNTISDVIRHIKGAFSRELGKRLREHRQTASTVAGGIHPPRTIFGTNVPRRFRGRNIIGQIWQDSFHDRLVRDPQELCAELQYLEFNPVRAELVDDPKSYEFSSANKKYETDLEKYL
ncbi:MAG: transposase [Candidatus Zixiibacteriota bacterium]